MSSSFSFWLALRPTNAILSPYCLCRSPSGARACTTYGHLHDRNTTTAPLTPLAFVNDSSARVCPESTALSEKAGAFWPVRGPGGFAGSTGTPPDDEPDWAGGGVDGGASGGSPATARPPNVSSP